MSNPGARSRLFSSRVRAALVVVALAAAPRAAAQDVPTASATDAGNVAWAGVLDSLVTVLEAVHPDPYRHVGREEFESAVERVRETLDGARPGDAATEILGVVALLEDGHTRLDPGPAGGFDRWYPIRFYVFSDGLYITTIDSSLVHVAGARVLRIGGLPADSVVRRVSRLVSADNEFGRREAVAPYLSSVPVLASVGAVDDPGELSLDVETRTGRPTRVVLSALESTSSMDWRFWGEMFGPPPSKEDWRGNAYATAFEGRKPMDYRSRDRSLPRHLRYRLHYWFEPLPEVDAIYLQWNFVLNDPDEPLTEFRQRLWAAYDSLGASRLILDIRYNSGGDGSMLLPFVHDLICREELRRPGGVTVLLGRKTFSAAVMLMSELDEHLPVVFVGEPAGAAATHFGDATTIDLPHGARLHVSTLDWRLGHPADTLRYQPVQVPAVFTGEEYFAGEDPAITVIREGEATPLVALVADDPSTAIDAYRRRAERFSSLSWWAPFSEIEMRYLGLDLLDAGDTASALVALELNTLHYTRSWKAWDAFGDGLAAADRLTAAAEAYRRALDLHPESQPTREKLEEIEPPRG